jgi:hypothetical protein
MNPWLSVPDKVPGKFRVGDRVRFKYNFPGVIAEIIEDRGRILPGKSRLYTVKLLLDGGEEFITERSEESLEAAEA